MTESHSALRLLPRAIRSRACKGRPALKDSYGAGARWHRSNGAVRPSIAARATRRSTASCPRRHRQFRVPPVSVPASSVAILQGTLPASTTHLRIPPLPSAPPSPSVCALAQTPCLDPDPQQPVGSQRLISQSPKGERKRRKRRRIKRREIQKTGFPIQSSHPASTHPPPTHPPKKHLPATRPWSAPASHCLNYVGAVGCGSRRVSRWTTLRPSGVWRNCCL